MIKQLMIATGLLALAACASEPSYPPNDGPVPTRDPNTPPPGGYPEDRPTPKPSDPSGSGQQGDGATQKPNEGQRLSNNRIREEFSNKSYYGCYNNGQNTTFAERTTSDGNVLDLDQDGVVTGRWEARSDRLCFIYPNQDANANCFVVTKAGSGYNFYTGDPGQLVASTNCPIADQQ